MLVLNQRAVKKIFIFFLIYLPLQYAMIGILGVLINEPWPAFALPGFKNIYSTESQTKVVKPFFYAITNDQSGEPQEVEVSEYQLFDGIKESQIQGFIRTHFSESQPLSSHARQWLQDRVQQSYLGGQSNGLTVVWREIIYESRGNSFLAVPGDEVKVIDISFAERE